MDWRTKILGEDALDKLNRDAPAAGHQLIETKTMQLYKHGVVFQLNVALQKRDLQNSSRITKFAVPFPSERSETMEFLLVPLSLRI